MMWTAADDDESPSPETSAIATDEEINTDITKTNDDRLLLSILSLTDRPALFYM